MFEPVVLRHTGIERISPFPVSPAGASDENRGLRFGKILWAFRFRLYPGCMHFRRALDVILALLFTPQASPFAALFERQFRPWGCCSGARHDLLPTANAEMAREGVPRI